jgi:hypothetical protein
MITAWTIAVLCMVLGCFILTRPQARHMDFAGIVGALLVAFGVELALALCYIIGVNR